MLNISLISHLYITDPEKAKNICDEIRRNDSNVIGIDIETTGLNPRKDKIRLIQIAIKEKPVYIFDVEKIGANGLSKLKEMLNEQSKIKIFHNSKFDLKFLYCNGIVVEENIFDTMLAEQVIMSGSTLKGFKLKDLTLKYLNANLKKELQVSDWSGRLTFSQLTYAANDAKVLLGINEKQIVKLEELNLTNTMSLENMALIPTIKMELVGFKIDMRAVRDLKVNLTEDINSKKEDLEILLPNVSNFGSPIQVKKALSELGLKIESTEKDELLKYKDDYIEVEKILHYKKLSKRISLLDSLINSIDVATGRIHASYWQCATKTGRYSCTEPNLQGVPNSKEFRKCFAADEGNVLVIADYSQIELRIIAEVSGDETMINTFKNNEDIHRRTAAIVNNKPVEDVTDRERQSAKAMNFGLIYGMGYKTFKKYAKNNYGVELSDEETKFAVDSFFLTYQGISNRINILNSLFTCEERTLGGRRRLWNQTPIITERANAAIQGTGADMLKQALVSVNKVLLNDSVKLIATVHDEIILECSEDKAKYVASTLKSLMEEAGKIYLKNVPVVADVSIGQNWSDK